MDIRINSQDGNFKFRVCGILKYKDKFLVVKINDSKFYCLPGGHVEIGEDTETAVKREMREELGYEIKIDRLVSIDQNFFIGNDGKNFHELGFYYLVEAKDERNINPNDYLRDELDKGNLIHFSFKWCTREELKKLDLRPRYIAECIDLAEPRLEVTRDD